MNRDRLKYRWLAPEHRVSTTRIGKLDATREPKLATQWISAYAPTRRSDRYLQPPATAEERHCAGKHGARQFDLPFDMLAAVIDIERRPGNSNAVVIGEASSRWQADFAIGGPDDIAGHRCQPLERLYISFSGRLAAGGYLLLPDRCAIPVDYQNPRVAHCGMLQVAARSF